MMRKFAVFDIDGTFFRSHLFWEVVLELAKREALHPKLNSYTVDLYERWKRREHKRSFEDFDGNSILALKELVTELDPEIYDSVMQEVITAKVDHVYRYPKELLQTLKKDGYFILAISGSRQEEVDIFAKHHGFDDWIGQKFERTPDGKRYTGNIQATFKDKHLLLQNFIEKHNLTTKDSFGMGDTGGDISLLEIVDNPIAFNPNHELLNHARDHGWKVVVERKSIAFSLVQKNGSYILESTNE
jgi:HAD superfamily phosphoserine phosphatase-like hydrolase